MIPCGVIISQLLREDNSEAARCIASNPVTGGEGNGPRRGGAARYRIGRTTAALSIISSNFSRLSSAVFWS
jgi:hypothetical protein